MLHRAVNMPKNTKMGWAVMARYSYRISGKFIDVNNNDVNIVCFMDLGILKKGSQEGGRLVSHALLTTTTQNYISLL
jgi:hypothetical protein